jgi:uncharacterized damage-inducible protein DinB
MADQKPPRLAGGERDTLQALLQYQRDSLLRKVAGIDDGAARRRLVGSGTTLLWLIKHMARAETVWILCRFAGSDATVPEDTVEPSDTLAEAVKLYQATWSQTDAVISAESNLDAMCRRVGDDPPVNLRWVLAHLLEETARHAGHADILRELIDGHTGR